MTNLEQLTAVELGRLVNSKLIKPSELLDYFLTRINNYNDKITAFVYINSDYAYAYAKKIEERIMRGEYVGLFAGVPFGLKDFLSSKVGWPCTRGGVPGINVIDDCNSIFCETMEKLGGIALGKTNAPSYGFRGVTDNVKYGPTKNPFNLEYNSGGSSGGSAAAVASGLVPISEGGDAGGSIRIPAAWCNCFGFKASAGSIPNVCRPDAWSATHPYCTPGGLVKSVEDAAILFSYMSKYDCRDPISSPFCRPNYLENLHNDIKNLRVAFTVNFGIFEVDVEIESKTRKFIDELKQFGISIEEVPFNFNPYTLNDISNAWCEGICVDTAIEYIEHPENFYGAVLPDEFLYWNNIVSHLGILDYAKFHKIRTTVYDGIQNIFNKYDLILSPTSCCLPVKNFSEGVTLGPSFINGKVCNNLIGFAPTFLFNLSGNPAASVPMGFSDTGLPIGIQVCGKRFRDEQVLAFSHFIETVKPWKQYYKYN